MQFQKNNLRWILPAYVTPAQYDSNIGTVAGKHHSSQLTHISFQWRYSGRWGSTTSKNCSHNVLSNMVEDDWYFEPNKYLKLCDLHCPMKVTWWRKTGFSWKLSNFRLCFFALFRLINPFCEKYFAKAPLNE